MKREQIIELIISIGQPEVYDTDIDSINQKTIEIKKLQKLHNFNFEDIRKLYLLNLDILREFIKQVTTI